MRPRPFRILPNVLDININGHSQAKMIIKSPASFELKKYVPMKWPVNIKKSVQANPKIVQYFKVLEVRVDILVRFPLDFSLETKGSNILATAQVIVVGNNINGIAIAVRIP